ncbi:MAG: hypothetical protein IJW73_02550, partial [Candidatus Gastranaerophilales bacterium]|nr:hypothetical protein [Candidatus Gastranaerophilales bacterium]
MKLSFLKYKKIIINIAIAIFLLSSSLAVYAETNAQLDNRKSEVEAQIGHAKKEIKKLKLLEKIETNRLYKNQQKLESNQHSLERNERQYKS